MGNLDAERDWGFAGDYVRAMWSMLHADEPRDYVIATGIAHSVRDLCGIAFAHVGLDYQDHVVTDPALFRPAEVDHLLGDATRARAELGWQVEVDFQRMIEMMVDADMERVVDRRPRWGRRDHTLMRVLVTGAHGFVGQWLQRELGGRGHEAIPAPPIDELDIADAPAVASLIDRVRPDGIIHLAGVSFVADAEGDPHRRCVRTSEAHSRSSRPAVCFAGIPAIVVVEFAEVYASPRDGQPLTEDSPSGASQHIWPHQAGGRRRGVVGRLAGHASCRGAGLQSYGARSEVGLRGPCHGGEDPRCSAPWSPVIPVGNVGPILGTSVTFETRSAPTPSSSRPWLVPGPVPRPAVVNVATGRSTPIRTIIDTLSRLADWPVELVQDASLVRRDDPDLIVGSYARLQEWTGWSPEIALRQTLADLVDAVGGLRPEA